MSTNQIGTATATVIVMISVYCDCDCHDLGRDHKDPGHQCFPVCAPCAFCHVPVRVIFLADHQATCPARAAFSLPERRTVLRQAANSARL